MLLKNYRRLLQCKKFLLKALNYYHYGNFASVLGVNNIKTQGLSFYFFTLSGHLFAIFVIGIVVP